MQIGIIGLPQSGKSEIFKLVTGEEPSVSGKLQKAIIQVPDPRLNTLAEMLSSKKVTYAAAEFLDAQARDDKNKSASETITALRDTDLLLFVVRGFDTPGLERHPENDLYDILTELAVIDLDIVLRRLEKLQKPARTNVPEEAEKEKALLEKARDILEAEKPLSDLELTEEMEKVIRSFQFLTLKPHVVIYNTDEDHRDLPESFAADSLSICAQLENELLEMEPDEQQEFMADMGIESFSRDRIISACLKALSLITFYTAGEKESKAYLVTQGIPIVNASGKIHSDIEKGFIRAEVFNYAKFKEAGSYKQAKANGDMQLVSRDYIVQDGDMLDVRFSV